MQYNGNLSRADFHSDEAWLKYRARKLKEQMSSSICGEDPGGDESHWIRAVKTLDAQKQRDKIERR